MSTPQVFFNPLDPDVRANPYPHYAELRAVDPGAPQPVRACRADAVRRLRQGAARRAVQCRHRGERERRRRRSLRQSGRVRGPRRGLQRVASQPRPAEAHPCARARGARVHAEGHRGVATPGHRDGRRDPRQGRGRRRVRPCLDARVPAAVPGDLRAPRHADRPARRAPGVVAGDHAHPRAIDLRGGARRPRPKRQSTCASSSRR